MRILFGDKCDKKVGSNVGKFRGGMVFHRALQRSLAVNKVVKDRFLKNRHDVTPMTCYSVGSRGSASAADIDRNPQETINKVAVNRKVEKSGRPVVCISSLTALYELSCTKHSPTVRRFYGI